MWNLNNRILGKVQRCHYKIQMWATKYRCGLQNTDVGMCPCHELKPLLCPLTATAICVSLELTEVQNVPAFREEKTWALSGFKRVPPQPPLQPHTWSLSEKCCWAWDGSWAVTPSSMDSVASWELWGSRLHLWERQGLGACRIPEQFLTSDLHKLQCMCALWGGWNLQCGRDVSDDAFLASGEFQGPWPIW